MPKVRLQLKNIVFDDEQAPVSEFAPCISYVDLVSEKCKLPIIP